MPDETLPKDATPARDLANTLSTAAALLAVCGLVWVALT